MLQSAFSFIKLSLLWSLRIKIYIAILCKIHVT